MMNKLLVPMLSCMAGGLLGWMFFGGLWWTIRRGIASRRPELWFLGSALLRMGITLVGFYFASGGSWERLVLCLVGFVTARIAVSWWTRLPVESRRHPAPEASHAPYL